MGYEIKSCQSIPRMIVKTTFRRQDRHLFRNTLLLSILSPAINRLENYDILKLKIITKVAFYHYQKMNLAHHVSPEHYSGLSRDF
jgi:hypothetical protein